MKIRKKYKSFFAMTAAMTLAVSSFPADGFVSMAAEEPVQLPARFDLREQGVVTPVKQQNPFGTCWSFGETAAAETSILSSLGETYASLPLDFSEKHLAWFAVHPVTAAEDPSQAGEGLYPLDPDQPYNTGGYSIYATSLYASGCGPTLESLFPYQGAQKMTEYEWLLSNKDEWLKQNQERLAARFHKELPKAGEDQFSEYLDYKYGQELAHYKTYANYSDKDDWSIPDTIDGVPARLISSGFVLKNGNILPDYQTYDAKGKWTGTNTESINAIKKELLNGRAVSIAYAADQSLPSQAGDGTYINYDTYAQYTYDAAEPPTHEVTIVGWDDNFQKNCFNKEKQPPTNGAWIVKNSWGSQTDAAPGEVGYNEWGAVNEYGQHTGYFYLSYHDRTICHAESMEFSQNMAISPDGMFGVYGYDHMPAMHSFTLPSKKILKTANVFTADASIQLKSVSTKTANADSRVLFEIYALNKNAADPEDGKKLASFSTTFEYAGYHRADLENVLTLKKGQKFSVVVTAYSIEQDGSKLYAATANAAYDKAKTLETMMYTGEACYAVGIINRGESYLCDNGQWADWSDASKAYKKDGLELDNFSIKAYAVAAR